jgi:lysine-N-methylase
MDLVDAPPEQTQRLVAMMGLEGPLTPYRQYLDDIRATAFQLLSLRAYPMSTRLFLLAYLGHRTARFFHKSIASLDEARLAAAIGDVTRPETVERWHRELAGMQVPEVLAAQLVTQTINERLRAQGGVFHALIQSIVAGYGDDAATAVDEQGRAVVPVERLWAAFAARREFWREALPGRIDLYFENYAKNFWMREWYVSSEDLLLHTLRLLIRVAMLRFLLFGHPALEAARALPIEARTEVLDRAAVEVFYKFSRDIEHDGAFLSALEASLVEHGFQTFSHAAFLALV